MTYKSSHAIIATSLFMARTVSSTGLSAEEANIDGT